VEDKKSMAEMVEELYEAHTSGAGGKKKEELEWKLPFAKKFGAPAKMKRNEVLTLLVRTNKRAKMAWKPIEDNRIFVKEWGKYYSLDTGCIIEFGKYPLAIVHEDIIDAYNPTTLTEKAGEEDRLTLSEKVIINEAKKGYLGLTKKGFPSMIIWGVILAIILGVIGYSLLKGKLF
jgi:hypothetical protein